MYAVELKIKSKHLALEPSIIRKEEAKLKRIAKRLRLSQESDYKAMSSLHRLQAHRRTDIRYEARATHLARAYIAKKPYNAIERKRKIDKEYHFNKLVIPRIVKMVNKYQDYSLPKISEEEIKQWFNA